MSFLYQRQLYQASNMAKFTPAMPQLSSSAKSNRRVS